MENKFSLKACNIISLISVIISGLAIIAGLLLMLIGYLLFKPGILCLTLGLILFPVFLFDYLFLTKLVKGRYRYTIFSLIFKILAIIVIFWDLYPSTSSLRGKPFPIIVSAIVILLLSLVHSIIQIVEYKRQHISTQEEKSNSARKFAIICNIIMLAITGISGFFAFLLLITQPPYSALAFIMFLPGLVFFPLCAIDLFYILKPLKHGYGFAIFSNCFKLFCALVPIFWFISHGGFIEFITFRIDPTFHLIMGIIYFLMFAAAIPSIYNYKRFKKAKNLQLLTEQNAT